MGKVNRRVGERYNVGRTEVTASNAGITITAHDHIEEKHTFEMRDRASGVTRAECILRTYLDVWSVQIFSERDIDVTWQCKQSQGSEKRSGELRNDHDERTEGSDWRSHTIHQPDRLSGKSQRLPLQIRESVTSRQRSGTLKAERGGD